MAPGLTLGPFGLWFNRNQTWGNEAGPWVNYLTRSSYLLQQGHYFADVAYFYGEEGPLTAVFGWKPIDDAPAGYAFDFVNSDVVLHELTLKDGRFVTPGGTSYRILYLGGRSQRMTLPVLRKIRDLLTQGTVVVGDRPTDSPSLADDPSDWKKVADSIWGKVASPRGERRVGNGRVYARTSANEVLASLGLPQDFEYSKPDSNADLMFLHRKLADGDLYFVDNRGDRAEDVTVTFRVAGKAPELWDAATGTTEPASYQTAQGRTTLPLHFDPFGAIFVVFRNPATSASRKRPEIAEAVVASLSDELNRNWAVSFEPDRGAPPLAQFPQLISWSESSNYGVRYFSGTATYSKTIAISSSEFTPGARMWLDLGDVENIADVMVNGKNLGIVWKTPFKIDVTGALVPGEDRIEIRVTNLWVNRMIGDEQPWSLKKYAFADFTPYKADSPLLPSGLLGPVRLISAAQP
jgi:hypothetical protein